MSILEQRLQDYLAQQWSDCNTLKIDGLRELPGGYSKETYRFDAHVVRNGNKETIPMVLRKDRPAISAIFPNSRQTEHLLLRRLREQTSVPVPRSYLVEMDPAVFGEPAMLIEEIAGRTDPTSLFKPDTPPGEAEKVARDLCEKLAMLHLAAADRLNSDHLFDDPSGLAVVADSWDGYMDSTLTGLINGYPTRNFTDLPVLFDAYLHMRRNKPRPLPLCLVHGELNPSNVIYKDEKVVGIVDWENAHIGDPREDLGWLSLYEALIGTKFFQSVNYPGGFLGYYNHLTGFEVTPQELVYFQMFSYATVGARSLQAIKRRMAGQHTELVHLYLIQPVIVLTTILTQLLGYPSPQAQSQG